MPPRRTRGRSPAKRAKRRAGASKNAATSPTWLWLLGGGALGAVIAVALFFHDQPRPERVADGKPATDGKLMTKAGKKPADKEYHLGDLFERVGDDKPTAVMPPDTKPPSAALARPPSDATTDTPVAENKPPPPPQPAAKPPPSKVGKASGKSGPRYWLQAGAFRSASQADSLKARLTLTGLSARVVSGRGGNNVLWYRVRVGPYLDKAALNRGRQRLKHQKLSSFVIKQTR